MMKDMLQKFIAPLKGHRFLLAVFGVYAFLCFAVPAFNGDINSIQDLYEPIQKVFITGALLLLFCHLGHIRTTKRNNLGENKK